MHSQTMKNKYDISSMICSIDELVRNRNYKRSEVTQMRRDGKLYNIRRGLYINTNDYQNLKPWEKYVAQLVAYARSAKKPIFSHQSAAILFNLALITVPKKIHVYCPVNSRGYSRDVVKHPRLTERTHLQERYFMPGASATSLLTTVIDCVSTLGFEEGVVLADSALRECKVSEEIMREAMLNYQGTYKEKVHSVARAISGKSESAGESLTRLILDQLDVEYLEQYWFDCQGRRYRVDFYLPELGLIVEFDGKLKYEISNGREQVTDGERLRERELLKSGYRIFRVDWNDVWRNPYRTMYQLREVIAKIRAERE